MSSEENEMGRAGLMGWDRMEGGSSRGQVENGVCAAVTAGFTFLLS